MKKFSVYDESIKTTTRTSLTNPTQTNTISYIVAYGAVLAIGIIIGIALKLAI